MACFLFYVFRRLANRHVNTIVQEVRGTIDLCFHLNQKPSVFLGADLLLLPDSEAFGGIKHARIPDLALRFRDGNLGLSLALSVFQALCL
jgi:hypothetical protein